MAIQKVTIIGAGTMGNGIAHVFAKAGYTVVLVEAQQAALDRGMQAIGKNLEREVSKNKITAQDRESALKRMEFAPRLNANRCWPGANVSLPGLAMSLGLILLIVLLRGFSGRVRGYGHGHAGVGRLASS